MAYPTRKRTAEPGPDEVKALRDALQKDELARLYVFHGEETYLRDHYIVRMREHLCGGLDELNFELFDGKTADPEAIREAVMVYPAFGGRRFVLVRDVDILHATGAMKELAEELFPQLPDTTVLVFSYHTIEYRTPDRELYKLVSGCGRIVDFVRADMPALENWVINHFRALGKNCGRAEASLLIFRCGGLMNDLLPEIEKIGHYCEGESVTRRDIEALSAASVEAQVFDLTQAVSERRCAEALRVLDRLLAGQQEPLAILGVLSGHMRQLYAAKLLQSRGKGEQDLVGYAGVRHPFVAKKLMSAARYADLSAVRDACVACAEADAALKSSGGDKRRILEMLLFRIIGTED